MEGDLYDLPGDSMDHAAHWETSILMHLRPELVEMDRIRGEVLDTPDGQKAAGVYGRDPRTDASVELGAKIVNRIADNLGRKAQELLAGLTRA
jgi:creatinine amidohydrolase/Fe(II)-dependent formamide hydrolase-like protein